MYHRVASALCGGMTTDTPYVDALHRHARRRITHLTVPGHKGGLAAPAPLTAALGDALALDVPLLLPGIDRPRAGDPAAAAPLARAEQRAARAWGAARTWFLTAGATQGNLAACLVVGDGPAPVVVQRSSHTSTFNGLALAGARATYVSPEVDRRRGIAHAVTAASLEAALLATPGARAVLLTSPSYHGTTADLERLVAIAHRRGAAVVVDESWGPHLPFSPDVPIDALAAGADLVISSTHKHLGSLGGSAMLHLGAAAPDWLDEAAVGRALALVSSTSPSSLLMASLDAARARAETDGAALLSSAVHTLAGLRSAVAEIPGFVPIGEEQIGRHGVAGLDPLRLCVDVTASGWTGQALAEFAREAHGVELELAQWSTIVACFGLGEPPADRGRRLIAVLEHAARAPAPRSTVAVPPAIRWSERAVERAPLGVREALWAPRRAVPLAEAAGHIAAEALVPYPPGIPVALPGERLRSDVLVQVAAWAQAGGALRGLADPTGATVLVVGDPAHTLAVGRPRDVAKTVREARAAARRESVDAVAAPA
ncbi:MAG: aminotransferase class I/II-fold pyridoxal phosphate-dependent enzyme [Solirubrobacteraceae bacterium]|nr:aminotransferase class I/II-fold pyridoxal phosphate-dependent enzyme [Solirubrobacteraceae bacterium]